MKVQVINADVIDGLQGLSDQSVQCCITSPPYWGLRDYGVEGQIGLEQTPEEYVARLVEVFREVRRVLRDDGTLWLNLGDCYAGSGKGASSNKDIQRETYVLDPNSPQCRIPKVQNGLKPKDLVGIPWRLAFALQADGWYLRSDVIWHKPNPKPESVTDRPSSAHEHIFLLTKSPRYFYDAEAVRETSKYTEVPGGRNRRDVWTIRPQPTSEAHFATFPEALVEICIKAGTSEYGCCPACGAPWVREVEKGEPIEGQRRACGADASGGYRGISHKMAAAGSHPPGTRPNDAHKVQNPSDVKRRILEGMRERRYSWHPSCTCNEGPIPCTVLDPFLGSGTVSLVARRLNRSSIGIELNPQYVEVIRRRLGIADQMVLDTGAIEYEIIGVRA